MSPEIYSTLTEMSKSYYSSLDLCRIYVLTQLKLSFTGTLMAQSRECEEGIKTTNVFYSKFTVHTELNPARCARCAGKYIFIKQNPHDSITL